MDFPFSAVIIALDTNVLATCLIANCGTLYELNSSGPFSTISVVTSICLVGD